ncbi:MAG: DUF2029 domain-containing protein [Kouleothrix sp.]|nr:DUF2029 domain-containing protein [Kouleothrix sp.]
MSRRSTYRADLLLALAAALLAAALIAIGFGRAWPMRLDVGAADARFVSGFHASQSANGISYRWTTASAAIALPQPPAGQGAILTLRLMNGRPLGQPDLHMQLSAGGQPLGAVVLAPSYERVYHFLIPPARGLGWATSIALRSDTVSLPDDPRPLGGGVDWVGLEALPTGPALPSAWLLLWGAGLGLLGYALMRGIGLSGRAALAGTSALAGLVALGVAARPLEVLPFVHRIVALLGLGCAAIWLARALAPPVPTEDQGPATSDQRLGTEGSARAGGTPRFGLSSFVLGRRVRGRDLPIYLAIAGWMGPAFQIVMVADGAQNIGAAEGTLWVGAALALGLAGLGGWYLLRGRRLPREQWTKTLSGAALALLAGAAVAHLGYMTWYAFQRQGPDFWILFKGAREWARGGSLYSMDEIITNHFGHVFKVPPFYGMLFAPFVFQDGERILLYHRMLNTILLGATALAWYRMWGLRLLSAAGAGMLILLNIRPMTDTIAFGQIDLALLLALTLALWALREERDLLAGVLVAFGTLLKIYPVLLLAFFVAKGRWRALAGFALGMLLFNALAVAVMGWEMQRVYLTEVLPRIGGTTSWVENQTISGFLARFFAPPTASDIFRNRAVALLGLAISGLVGLGGCVLALWPARPRSTGFALQYGQFMLLMVLVVPAAWMHYETLLFLPFAALLLHERERLVGLPRAAALATSFALISYGNPWSFYDGTVMGILTVAGVSYKFYGMLLLGGVLAATLLAERAPTWSDLAQAVPWRRRVALRAER